jgi:hypothetical protein
MKSIMYNHQPIYHLSNKNHFLAAIEYTWTSLSKNPKQKTLSLYFTGWHLKNSSGFFNEQSIFYISLVFLENTKQSDIHP